MDGLTAVDADGALAVTGESRKQPSLSMALAIFLAISATALMFGVPVPRHSSGAEGGKGTSRDHQEKSDGQSQSQLGSAKRMYWPIHLGKSLQAHGDYIRSRFTGSGAAFNDRSGEVSMALTAMGREGHMHPVSHSYPKSSANTVEYRHGAVSEFYTNGPSGVEQSFILRRPQGGRRGALLLSVRLGGELIPVKAGSQVAFVTASGAIAFRYGELSATDAYGSRLPARMEVRGDRLLLAVDDATAHYPLRIDPFVSAGEKLVGDREGAASYGTRFGSSVALAAGGNTALVGIPGEDEGLGAVWVFSRTSSLWVHTGTLKLPEEADSYCYGVSTGLSLDGNTAFVGGLDRVWVFVREGSTWTRQSSALAPTTGGETEPPWCPSIAASEKGDTVLISDTRYENGNGAAWIYARSDSGWTKEAKLTGAKTLRTALFGASVALSSDGDTALVGSPEYSGTEGFGDGIAQVFVHSGSDWVQQGAALTGPGENGAGGFGSSVALSASGDSALVGAPEDASSTGAVWTFRRAGGLWSQNGPQLTPSEATEPYGAFGSDLALSADGTVALVAAPKDDLAWGSVYAFTRTGPGAAWTQQGSKLRPINTKPTGYDSQLYLSFGSSIALTPDGNTALIGAPEADTDFVGAVLPFVYAPPTVSEGTATTANTAATLTAAVNAGGRPSQCIFEYGPGTSYGSTAPCTHSPGSSSIPVEVSASLTGLVPNTTYHFRAGATSPAGTGYGEDASFRTTPNPPTVRTGAASSVSQTYATLNGAVNPEGGHVGDCRLEFGATAIYGSSVPCSRSGLDGQATQPVSGVVNVSARTTYHFRLVASSEGGTSYGEDQTFITPALSMPALQTTMTWLFGWGKHYTVVRSLIVHGVPAGAHVEVSCHGRGCPFARSHTATAAARKKKCHGKRCAQSHVPHVHAGPTVSLTGLFKGRHLTPGAHILVSVSKTGWIGKGFLFTVRSSDPPKSQIGCLVAGATTPGTGC